MYWFRSVWTRKVGEFSDRLLGLGYLLQWYTNRPALEVSHLFYDQNEFFIRSIRQTWLKVRNPKKRVVDDLFWGRIASIEPVAMKNTPGIQAADVIAWSFTRRLRDEPDDEWATLATTLIGNRRQRGILTCTQVDPITEAEMRKRYPKKN